MKSLEAHNANRRGTGWASYFMRACMTGAGLSVSLERTHREIYRNKEKS